MLTATDLDAADRMVRVPHIRRGGDHVAADIHGHLGSVAKVVARWPR